MKLQYRGLVASPAIRVAAVVVAAAQLSACVVGPDYKTPTKTVPTSWHAADAAISTDLHLARWWKQFHDPVLNALVDEAITANPEVARAKASIQEARANVRLANGGRLPSISSESLTSRNRGSQAAAEMTPTTYNLFQLGFDTSWELDLFGGRKREVEALTYAADAAQDDYRAVLVTLVGDVVMNYIELSGLRQRIDLARQTVGSQERTATLTQSLFLAGSASATDVDYARGELAKLEASIPFLEEQYAARVHRLSVLTGRPPASLVGRFAGDGSIPTPTLPIPAGFPADILSNRPDVRAAERRYAQAVAQIGQAEARRYPSVTLTGSIATSASNFGELGLGSTIGWRVGPNISLPLFNGGSLRAGADAAEARKNQRLAIYESTVLTALEDVENALVGFNRSRIEEERLLVATRRFSAAASQQRRRYEVGDSSLLETLDADRSLYSSNNDLILSRMSVSLKYIALNKALGGGWETLVPTS